MDNTAVWVPISERSRRIRDRYRETRPAVCSARLNIVTDYYKKHLGDPGLLIRAGSFKDLCEKMPILINDDEIIVGSLATTYRGAALYPEVSGIRFLCDEIRSGDFFKRKLDPYDISDDTIKAVFEAEEFWERHNSTHRVEACAMEGFASVVDNGVLRFRAKGMSGGPVGHFCTNFDKAIRRGFADVAREAREKMAALEGKLFGDDAGKYHFYKAVAICCDGAIIFAKRYAAAVRELAEKETEPGRKEELYTMAEGLDWIFENPCRTLLEATQALFMYQLLLALDGNLHGLTLGRVDQYLGSFYEADIAAGRITPEYGQEIIDQFFLKIAEMNKVGPARISMSVGGYTSGQIMTLGGIKKDGTDASNAVSYMMLQAAGRLALHDPPLALRIHKGTPQKLWDLAIETTKRCGGVPTFENDDVIIPALMDVGLTLESARNYCIIGCVEPAGCGDDWPAPGGTGGESYFNIPNTLIHAINNGVNPLKLPGGQEPKRTGLPTGYLYEMKSFDEVKEAFRKQMEFFVDWHVSMTNMFEYATRDIIPVPLASAMMDGCMEKGKDVMSGGARFNSTGIAGVGIGTAADSLTAIKYLVFDHKICTGRELYDAIMNDWVGYEDLRKIVLNKVPHYGNDDPYADEIAGWVMDTWCEIVNSKTGPRGRYKAGAWSVARHVAEGLVTVATPDGRKLGDPLSDGISPKQGADVNGPTAVLKSVAVRNHRQFRNGTLLNMRFHPSSLSTYEDKQKFKALIQTYFEMGGMEMQFNIISTDTLYEAQKKPDEYKDLVVRVAGFSAYFVELHPALQTEIIRRTELSL